METLVILQYRNEDTGHFYIESGNIAEMDTLEIVRKKWKQYHRKI